MTHYESAEGVHVTRRRAMREIASHGAAWADFVADCGDHESYDAQAVLTWLGY